MTTTGNEKPSSTHQKTFEQKFGNRSFINPNKDAEPQPVSSAVEFIPVETEPEEKTSELPGDERNAVAKELFEDSRGHLDTMDPPHEESREIDTESARDALSQDVDGMGVHILQEDSPGKDADDFSKEDAHVFEEVLNRGFLDEQGSAPDEIKKVEEEMKRVTFAIKQRADNNEWSKEDTRKIELEVIDLSRRYEEVVDARGNMTAENLSKELNRLTEEIATVGSKEWVKRFITAPAVLPPAQEPQTVTESAAAEPPAEPIKTEKDSVVSAEIEAQFQKDFAFGQEELKNIVTKIETPEGEKTVRFSDLTEGQQLLLLENLKGFALDNAKEQALKQFTEEEKERYGRTGFIKKAFLTYFKSYRRAADMAQTENDILTQPELNRGTYTEVLRDMLAQASEAPEAEWKDGKLQINFALEKDFAGLDLKKINREGAVRSFNDAAGKFADTPAEFAFSKNENEQKQYREAMAVYANARAQLLNLKAEGGKEGEALEYVATLDKKIQFTQLFHTNPDVEKSFEESREAWSWLKGVQAITKEKGGLWAMGRGLSTLGAGVAVSIGSGFVAPLAAALAGGFLGGSVSGATLGWLTSKKRAEQEITDKKNLAEMGILDQSNQAEFRAASETKTIAANTGGEEQEIGTGLAEKLEYALTRVLSEETGDPKEKEKLLKVLGDRMVYTEKKLSMGVVNFGEGGEGFTSRYELLSALAKARTITEMNEPLVNEKVEKKIDEILGTQANRIAGAEKDYKSAKIRQGMKYGFILGGTFGTILSSISYAHAHGAEDVPVAQTPAASPRLVDELLQKINAPKTDMVSNGLQDVDKMLPSQAAPPIPHVGAHPIPPLAEGSLLTDMKTPNFVSQGLDSLNAQNAPSDHTEFVSKDLQELNAPLPQIVPPVEAHPILPVSGGHIFPEAVKIPESTFPEPKWDVPETTAGHGGTVFPEAVKIPENTFPEPKWSSLTETPDTRHLSIEDTLHRLGETYTVKQGDNVWNIIKGRLSGNEEFAKLEPRQQNFIIDSLKDKITNMSEKELLEIGIKKDPNLIYPGDTLKFGKVFKSSDELTKIFNRGEGLHTPQPASPQAIPATTEAIPTPVAASAEPLPAPEIKAPVPPIEGVARPVAVPQEPPLRFPEPSTDPSIDAQNTQENIARSIWETNQKVDRSILEAQIRSQQSMNEGIINSQISEMGTDPYLVLPAQIPAPYQMWAEHGMDYSRYPNMTPDMWGQFHNQRLIDMTHGNYNQTVDIVNRTMQLFGIRTPLQLSHIHSNDTMETLWARMAWRTAQSSGQLPAGFPDPYSILGTIGRVAAPQNQTDFNSGIDALSTRINTGITELSTQQSVNNSITSTPRYL